MSASSFVVLLEIIFRIFHTQQSVYDYAWKLCSKIASIDKGNTFFDGESKNECECISLGGEN